MSSTNCKVKGICSSCTVCGVVSWLDDDKHCDSCYLTELRLRNTLVLDMANQVIAKNQSTAKWPKPLFPKELVAQITDLFEDRDQSCYNFDDLRYMYLIVQLFDKPIWRNLNQLHRDSREIKSMVEFWNIDGFSE